MSRIGRQPIPVPAGVTAKVDGSAITVTGPKGTLSLTVADPIVVSEEGGTLVVTRPDDERASRALHGLTRTLVSNMVTGVTQGYIAGWHVEDATVGKTLTLDLKYGPSRERSIAGLRRVSKPGLRVYAKSTALPRVLGGLGIAILSTSSGLLTDRQAAQKGVGGEVLAYVW